MTVVETNEPGTLATFEELISLVLGRKYDAIRAHLAARTIDVNREDFRGVTALHYAAELGDAELVALLLSQQKISLNKTTLTKRTTPLMLAARQGHGDVVALLLDAGADAAIQDIEGFTALMLAAEAGHLDVLVALLAAPNCNINAQTERGQNALMLGVEHVAVVERLLARPGRDTLQRDMEGFTVLHHACKRGYIDVIRRLLLEDIPVNAISAEGVTPLMLVVQRDDLAAVRLLLAHGADMTLTDRIEWSVFHYAVMFDARDFLAAFPCPDAEIASVLCVAATKGDLDRIVALLETSSDPDAVLAESANDALVEAAARGHPHVIVFLLPTVLKCLDSALECILSACEIAIINNNSSCFKKLLEPVVDIYGATNLLMEFVDLFLTCAADHGRTDICTMLLALGNDVRFRAHISTNSRAINASLWAASVSGHTGIVAFLIKHGADVNAAHEVGGTALLMAATNGHLELVQLLLKHGADPNVADAKGFTPLTSAAFYDRPEIVQELLKRELNVNVPTADGLSPLMAAASIGSGPVAEVLLSRGACMSSTDEGRNSALHLACERGSLRVVELLLARGETTANFLHRRNLAGLTPADLALKTESIKFLQSLFAGHPTLMDSFHQPTVVPVEAGQTTDMCPICRDDYCVGDMTSILPCKHRFHETCYDDWATSRPHCPLCLKFPIVRNDVDGI